MSATEISMSGWDIARSDEAEWTQWGASETGGARAKVLARADGYMLVLIEAEPGYQGTAHEHAHPEFLYVLDGELRNQGVVMRRGDGYAAATGSFHTDFATETGATYVLVFKL
jgi:ChrR Cupin-like domain